jgi:diguanylate cyclase (GGDEF)-like protein
LILSGRMAGTLIPLHKERMVVGRGEDVDLRIADEGVSRRHFLLEQSEEGKLRIVDLRSKNGTFVNGSPVTEATLEDGDRIQIGSTTLIQFSYKAEEEARFALSLYESATHDFLTGAYNRGAILKKGEELLELSFRSGEPLAILLLDVDHFKAINDQYGHLAGDQVLRSLHERIRSLIRAEDSIGRYGGEEFLLLLPRTTLPHAGAIAERIREGVSATPVPFRDLAIPVTISVGLASSIELIDPSRGILGLIEIADQRLYRAKREGRNRVVGAGEGENE